MNKTKKAFLILMVILNIMVLSGQLWPEAVPPFGRAVNILTLSLNLMLLIIILTKKNIGNDSPV